MSWGPSISALSDFRREMERVFQRLDEEWDEGPLIGAEALGMTGGPRLEMSDSGEAVVVTAELPGFEAEDVQVSVEKGVLTIRGERRDEAPEGYTALRKERGAIRFARSIALPARVETDDVEANLKNGLLELRLPKVAAERPRSISIQAN